MLAGSALDERRELVALDALGDRTHVIGEFRDVAADGILVVAFLFLEAGERILLSLGDGGGGLLLHFLLRRRHGLSRVDGGSTRSAHAHAPGGYQPSAGSQQVLPA